MPWESKSVKERREEFIKECQAGKKSMAAICREYEISRTCGYKWLNRYRSGESMDSQSRRPLCTANRVDEQIEQLIVAERNKRPAWGPKKLKRHLENNGVQGLPCISTFENILKRNGLITPEASAAATAYKRFVKANPNDMWQTDFKGDFLLGDGARCYPLTCTDDCSRMNLCLNAEKDTKMQPVQRQFNIMFEEYGLPLSILCDNGNPWGTSQSIGYTKLEIWWMKHGILPIHGRPKHPQTQGKEERFHRTFKREVLAYGVPQNITEAQRRFDEYRIEYNTIRPHEALGQDTPQSHYERSQRRQTLIEEWDYDERYDRRKIKGAGYLTYKGQGYFISEALGGESVGIRESQISGCVTICFRQFAIARIDMNEHCITSRRIRLDMESPINATREKT